MKKQYRVTFTNNGYIVHTCVQVATCPEDAIEYASMYFGGNNPFDKVTATEI